MSPEVNPFIAVLEDILASNPDKMMPGEEGEPPAAMLQVTLLFPGNMQTFTTRGAVRKTKWEGIYKVTAVTQDKQGAPTGSADAWFCGAHLVTILRPHIEEEKKVVLAAADSIPSGGGRKIPGLQSQ